MTTEILSTRETRSRADAGIVEFLHKAYNQRGELVAECRRQGMMRKRPKAVRLRDALRCCSFPPTTRRSSPKAWAPVPTRLILDLEDFGQRAPTSRRARALAKAYIEATAAGERRPQILVRINALDTPYWQDDLIGVIDARPDAILLPKARSGEDVHTLSVALGSAEQRAAKPGPGTRIIALTTETPDLVAADA